MPRPATGQGMARQRARRLWLASHRWLGLLLGPPVVLLCLSGIALSYADAIDAVLNPRLHPPAAAPAVPPGRLLQAAAGDCAGAAETWLWLPHGQGPARIACRPPGRPMLDIVVDTGDGRLLGVRDQRDSPLGFLVGLHTTLLLGEAGRLVAGALAAVLAVSVVSGAVLWWPRGGAGAWARALRIRPWRGPGLVWRLHRVAGALAGTVLLVVATTALRLQFPETAVTLLRPVDAVASAYRIGAGLRTPPPPEAEPLPVDALVAAAAAAFPPDAVLTDLWLPADPTRPAMIGFRQPFESNKDAGHSLAWVEQGTGHVLRRHDPFAADPGMAALTWLENLHSGEALGLAGRLAVEAAALVAALLWATGLWAWWRRRRPG